MDKTTHPNLLNALGVEQITASEKGVMISTAQAEKTQQRARNGKHGSGRREKAGRRTQKAKHRTAGKD